MAADVVQRVQDSSPVKNVFSGTDDGIVLALFKLFTLRGPC